MNRYLIAAAGAPLAVMGMAESAQAAFNNVTLENGDVFSLVSCSASLNLCNNLTMVPNSSADPTGIVIEQTAGTSTPILTSASGDTDVSFEFQLSGPVAITQIGAAILGNNGGNSANNNAITMTEEVTYGLGGSNSTSVVLNGPEEYVTIPPGFTTVDIDKDLKLNTSDVVAGTTVTVNSVAQNLVVPEPASLTLMMSGLLIAAAGGVSFRRR